MARVRNMAGAPGVARAGGLGREFRDFILRGNVVDLAIGIISGAAWSSPCVPRCVARRGAWCADRVQ